MKKVPESAMKYARVAIFFIASSMCWQATAQSASPPISPGSVAKADRAVSVARTATHTVAVSPLQSRFSVQKVATNPAGVEVLEDAANVSVGDIVQYKATHRNISRKRLLNVDFAIPVPRGTRYVQGSAWPETGVLGKNAKNLDQMAWHFDAVEPSHTVQVRLRVEIEPDDTLTPTPPAPRRPQLR